MYAYLVFVGTFFIDNLSFIKSFFNTDIDLFVIKIFPHQLIKKSSHMVDLTLKIINKRAYYCS
jgi:hypothetical protein